MGFPAMRYLLTATLMVSAAAIAYEILLVRLLSIVQWHHFAWMVISLALLGYGASGTVVALARRWLQPRFETVYAVSALAFAVAMVVCFVLGQRVPFNALEIAWDPLQAGFLGLMYLLFMVPFFFAASCIALAFTCRGDWVDRIYLCDLLGAGLGALAVLAALFLLWPEQALLLLSGLALLASVLMLGSVPRYRLPLAVGQLAWLAVLIALAPAGRIELHMSEFKGLSQALQVVDSRVLEDASSPLGLLTVVASPRVPFRHAPGLSFTARAVPPEQLALFTDGDGLSPVTRFEGDLQELAYLDDVTAALPYRLLEEPATLVLGAGAGADVLLALRGGASHIDAVEVNPQVVELMRGSLADFSGGLYDHEAVQVHVAEARGFVARSRRSWDLIQVGLMDAFSVSGSGVQSLNENHLYTVEAIRRYLGRLTPGGLLAVTRWLHVPPRDSLKLAATLIEALRQEGVADPGRRLVVIRSWNTVTLLTKSGEFDRGDIETLRRFARERAFDTAWFPGMSPADANRYNQLDRPWLSEGIAALLGPEPATFIDRYKFHIAPASDDRPYFHRFFRWRVLPELLDLRERGGAGLIGWGYLVLAATLLQAVLAGAFLILLPLAFARRKWPPGFGRRMGGYFVLLGLAFLFVEIAFIQKFMLFLSHPLYAVAVVLAGFLVFAGLGSGCSSRLAEASRARGLPPVSAAVAGISALALLYLLLLPPVFERFMGWPDVARIALSLALIAPLAFLMGLPFPLVLGRVARDVPDFVPWAWGLNGFASVVSAALATLLAVEFGFTVVILVALLLYALAAALAGWRAADSAA
jgi:spermidine synthase